MGDIQERMQAALEGRPHYGPVSEGAIQEAESALEVHFPPSYRTFLSRFGAALLSCEIAGVTENEDNNASPSWSSVVKDTLRARRASRGHLSKHLIRVSDDGADIAFFLATGLAQADGECPVVALGPGYDEVKVAESFVEFLERAAHGYVLQA